MSAGRRRFRIIKEIAEGGFGKVYLAEQISVDGFSRIVAVKLLHAKWSSHDEVVMRTRDEARLLGLIRHQHIVKVEDLTSLDGKCAIVMEYLEGCDLKWMFQFLKDRGKDFPRAALFEIVLAVASALDAAYNGVPLQGAQPLRVIHRDIKPSNIFVTVAGGVKVLDFGTARANFAEREAKTQALAFGSQGYMAPERMLGEEDTPAADIFSLGIALYEILSLESFGRIPPRPTKFAAKVDERVRSIPLEGPAEWCDQVRDTLRIMLSYEANQRPSAGQLVDIMEILAQDAKDMGLRRFCRTLVAEAKAHLPELESGDPLAGRIVEEDQSFGRGLKGGANTTLHLDDDVDIPPTERMKPAQVTGGFDASGPAAPAAPSAVSAPISAPQKREPTGAMQKVGEPADVEDGSGRLVKVLAGGGVLVLALVVIGILLVAGLLFFVLFNPSPTSTSPPSVTVEPAPQPDTPPPDTPAPVAASGPAGLQMDAAGAGGVQVELALARGAPAKIVVRGPDSRFTWDGVEPVTLDLAPGKYRSQVKLGDGTTFRLETFDVEDGGCAFTFDPDAEEWKGGCGG